MTTQCTPDRTGDGQRAERVQHMKSLGRARQQQEAEVSPVASAQRQRVFKQS